MTRPDAPGILVFSSLFPHQGQPTAGLFIRERMFRVAQRLPLVVVAPVPWFPLQGLIRRFKPHFRPPAPRHERQSGIDVYFPRYLCFPGVLKRFDGFFMALGAWRTVRRLERERGIQLIDSHFAYPDGYAATRLGGWLHIPVVITLRGTEFRMLQSPPLRKRLLKALADATSVISVADSLRQLVVQAGTEIGKIQVIGNGVDVGKFSPIAKSRARELLGLGQDDPVLISVGGLVPRKGYHRVIEVLPRLLEQFPRLRYLVVGAAGPEGDFREALEAQVAQLGLQHHVQFLGGMPSEELKIPLSAADLFVLATSNEGWANVFLEAMACGLPVVTTRVGGNAEVVSDAKLGLLVELGDPEALALAIEASLRSDWDRQHIMDYASANCWDGRVERLVETFIAVCATGSVAAEG